MKSSPCRQVVQTSGSAPARLTQVRLVLFDETRCRRQNDATSPRCSGSVRGAGDRIQISRNDDDMNPRFCGAGWHRAVNAGRRVWLASGAGVSRYLELLCSRISRLETATPSCSRPPSKAQIVTHPGFAVPDDLSSLAAKRDGFLAWDRRNRRVQDRHAARGAALAAAEDTGHEAASSLHYALDDGSTGMAKRLCKLAQAKSLLADPQTI
jgi:hypothetical protein